MKDDMGHGLLGNAHGGMVGGLLSEEALSPLPSWQYSRARSQETDTFLVAKRSDMDPLI